LIETWRSKIDRNTPRFNRRLVSVAKKPSTALSHEQDVGVKWKAVSNRVAERHHLFDNPNDALVLKFIAADSEKKLLAFLSEYGMPKAWLLHGIIWEPLSSIESDQETLREILGPNGLATFNWQEGRHAVDLMLRPRAGERPRLALQCNSLRDYMHAEAGMILSGAGRLMTCQHCGKFFVVGTGRCNDGFRSNKTHCSPACVTAASRARKKARDAGRST
jgi:hypothetical protein